MKLRQAVAGAAIGCALSVTGMGMASGIAAAAPCPPTPGVQCGGGPSGPPPQRGPSGPPQQGPQGGPPQGPQGGPPQGPQGGPPQGPQGGPPQGDFHDQGPQGGPPGDFRNPGGPDFRGPGGPPGDFHNPGGGSDFRTPDNHDWRPPWNAGDNDWRGRFRGAPWGDGLPPWGFGAPPPPPWDGPLPNQWGAPPPAFNYEGFQEQPVWDNGYNQWGFYFFGIWIPLPV